MLTARVSDSEVNIRRYLYFHPNNEWATLDFKDRMGEFFYPIVLSCAENIYWNLHKRITGEKKTMWETCVMLPAHQRRKLRVWPTAPTPPASFVQVTMICTHKLSSLLPKKTTIVPGVLYIFLKFSPWEFFSRWDVFAISKTMWSVFLALKTSVYVHVNCLTAIKCSIQTLQQKDWGRNKIGKFYNRNYHTISLKLSVFF